MGNFELDPSYKDVPARIADFKAKHPEGCFRPVDPSEPYKIEALDGRFFIVYTAAAYRSPEDPLPGIGVAWEPFPGKTPYTKDSELQNAETSAWGRAIVAVLASESKSVASAEDVRNRQADREVQPVERFTAPDGTLVEVWPGELSVKTAKDRLVEAAHGDKDAAGEAWAATGFNGKLKVTENELAPVLAKIGAGASLVESPSAAGATAGSNPASAAPAPNGEPVVDTTSDDPPDKPLIVGPPAPWDPTEEPF